MLLYYCCYCLHKFDSDTTGVRNIGPTKHKKSVLINFNSLIRALAAVELKNYNAILAPPIYQKSHAAVEVKL